jgi:hypothetical protein
MTDSITFDEYVELLRIRLNQADRTDKDRLHSFKRLSEDLQALLPERWYWQAFEQLASLGHLSEDSSRGNSGDAYARLSTEGRTYLHAKVPGQTPATI